MFEGKRITKKEKSDLEEFVNPGLVAILSDSDWNELEMKSYTPDI